MILLRHERSVRREQQKKLIKNFRITLKDKSGIVLQTTGINMTFHQLKRHQFFYFGWTSPPTDHETSLFICAQFYMEAEQTFFFPLHVQTMTRFSTRGKTSKRSCWSEGFYNNANVMSHDSPRHPLRPWHRKVIGLPSIRQKKEILHSILRWLRQSPEPF